MWWTQEVRMMHEPLNTHLQLNTYITYVTTKALLNVETLQGLRLYDFTQRPQFRSKGKILKCRW